MERVPELVECLSGSAYADKPLAFTWQGQRHRVEKILAEGRTPQVKWFKVTTGSGAAFELSWSEETGNWQIQSF